jgi:hypothetical protein
VTSHRSRSAPRRPAGCNGLGSGSGRAREWGDVRLKTSTSSVSAGSAVVTSGRLAVSGIGPSGRGRLTRHFRRRFLERSATASTAAIRPPPSDGAAGARPTPHPVHRRRGRQHKWFGLGFRLVLERRENNTLTRIGGARSGMRSAPVRHRVRRLVRARRRRHTGSRQF